MGMFPRDRSVPVDTAVPVVGADNCAPENRLRDALSLSGTRDPEAQAAAELLPGGLRPA